jgi:hypothetical protein
MTPEILQGPAREPLDRTEIDALRSSVIIDERRRRPLYFDGRFLAARDLVREQSYFLTRQADLGRAGGTGVVRGLMVERGPTTGTLRIAAGHGLTAAGEPVMLPDPLVVKLDDLPQIQRLDLTLGLLEIPREPVRNRSGVYILALRPVEFTSNPIASYPISIDGQRGMEDGDIIEGTVVTLIPYPDAGSGTTDERRARAAYDIFVRGGTRGRPAPVLPLAMVSLNLNTVEWVDPFLVRREVGAEQEDVLGVGFAPRALREAHVLQYDYHLREVLAARGGLRQRFAASEYFRALPPAGRMPAAAISADFTQIWFPPTMEVDLSIVPADEVPALLEESFNLPPIDLTRSAEELDAISVVVLIPVPRSDFAAVANALESLQRPLPPATPWMLARRQPIDVLRGLRFPTTLIRPQSTAANDARWTEALNGMPMLWYARRRHLASRADVTGVPVTLAELRERVDEAAGNPPRDGSGITIRPPVLEPAGSSPAIGGRPPSDVPAAPAPEAESASTPPGAGVGTAGGTGDSGATTGLGAPPEIGVRPPSSFPAAPAPEAESATGTGTGTVAEPAPSAPEAGSAAAGMGTVEPTVTFPTYTPIITQPVGEITLTPELAEALREAMATSGGTTAPEGETKTSTLSGTIQPVGEITLPPTLTNALREAITGSTSGATTAEGETKVPTVSGTIQPVGEITLPPTLTNALREAVAGSTSSSTAPAGETATPASSGTIQPVGEVTLSSTLLSALREAVGGTPTAETAATGEGKTGGTQEGEAKTPIASGTTTTVGEVTLTPTLSSALREAVMGSTTPTAPTLGSSIGTTPTTGTIGATGTTSATGAATGSTLSGATLSGTTFSGTRLGGTAPPPLKTGGTLGGTGSISPTFGADAAPQPAPAGATQPVTDAAGPADGSADTRTLVAPSGEPLRETLAAEADLAAAAPSVPTEPAQPEVTSALAQAVIEAVQKEEAAGKEVPVASETLLANPTFGAGLARLEEARPELATDTRAITNLARSGVIQELDQLAATEPAAELADEVASLAAGRTRTAPARLADAVRTRLPRGGAR